MPFSCIMRIVLLAAYTVRSVSVHGVECVRTWCEACPCMMRSVFVHDAKRVRTWCGTYRHMGVKCNFSL